MKDLENRGLQHWLSYRFSVLSLLMEFYIILTMSWMHKYTMNSLMPGLVSMFLITISSFHDIRLSLVFVNHHKDQLLALRVVQQVVVTVK